MVRGTCGIEIGFMACQAFRGGIGVLAILMAIRTRCDAMPSFEGKGGGMLKVASGRDHGALPFSGIVALRAVLAEFLLGMVRFGCGVEILFMAAHAFRLRSDIPLGMAFRALGLRVPAHQGKCFRMLELGALRNHADAPVFIGMAGRAFGGKVRFPVVGLGRLIVIILVACGAFGNQARKRILLVAIVTRDLSMGSGKRQRCGVIHAAGAAGAAAPTGNDRGYMA